MRKQLRLLFLYGLLIWSTGNGLLPLLPVYALEGGAPPQLVGALLAGAYLALALGTLSASPMLATLGSRKVLLVGAMIPPIPALLLLSAVGSVWYLGPLVAVIWFCAGLSLTVINISVALYADRCGRGKSFGLMFVGMPLGAVLGGTTIGAAVERWGYPTMFALLGCVWLGMLLLVGTALENDRASPTGHAPEAPATDRVPRSPATMLLLSATLIMAVTSFVARLTISVSMHDLDFSALSIAGTMVASGSVALPVPWLAGTLSDRYGRRGPLGLAYLLAASALVTLATATQLWHFLLAAALLSIAGYAASTISAALMVDLVPAPAIPAALSLLNSMSWIGAIVGFASAGHLMESIGAARLSLGSAGLILVATAMAGLTSNARVVEPRPEALRGAGK